MKVQNGTSNYLRDSAIDFTFTNYNSGICEGINKASKLPKYQYFLYTHDDFFFALIGMKYFIQK